MLRVSEGLVRNLARASVLGGALAPALIYALVGFSGLQQMATDDARVQARRASSAVAANPEVWRYATDRLVDQVQEVRHIATHTHLTDADGKVLAQVGEECTGICVEGRAPLMDFGKTVGEVRVSTDLVPTLTRSAGIGAMGLAIGFLLIRLLDRHVLLPLERIRVTNVELAFYDPLTRLSNRRLLMDRLGHALVGSQRSRVFGALLMLDLDNFKTLNDTRGHDAGDQLLIEVARRVSASVRQEDTVSRIGGDEFVVILEGLGTAEATAAKQAEAIAEKIHRALNQPYAISASEKSHHSTPSIGVTLFQGQEHSIDVLLKQADVAMYQAKGAGRNTIRFFNPQMQAAIDSRSAMESALRKGLQQGEMQLHYQPQMGSDGELTGAEALLRWIPAGKTPVSPAEFIPLEEDTGLIVPIGLWVMQTACAQLSSWAKDPRTNGLQIAINVSARQFRQPDFVQQVYATLRDTAANPASLKLELTESVVLENVEKVIQRMQQIRELGVTFSLDDFGTGYSSLSYLKRLPLDQVKIDKSFIDEVTSDRNDAAIVRAIIAMSQALGMQVIAEGVETEAQLDFLKNCGCANFQGYHFGKPTPIKEWERFL